MSGAENNRETVFSNFSDITIASEEQEDDPHVMNGLITGAENEESSGMSYDNVHNAQSRTVPEVS